MIVDLTTYHTLTNVYYTLQGEPVSKTRINLSNYIIKVADMLFGDVLFLKREGSVMLPQQVWV